MTDPKRICRACSNWNHWHDTPDGSCEDPRCECTYRRKAQGGHGHLAHHVVKALFGGK